MSANTARRKKIVDPPTANRWVGKQNGRSPERNPTWSPSPTRSIGRNPYSSNITSWMKQKHWWRFFWFLIGVALFICTLEARQHKSTDDTAKTIAAIIVDNDPSGEKALGQIKDVLASHDNEIKLLHSKVAEATKLIGELHAESTKLIEELQNGPQNVHSAIRGGQGKGSTNVDIGNKLEIDRVVHWLDLPFMDGQRNNDYQSGAWLMPIKTFKLLRTTDMLAPADELHRVWDDFHEDIRMPIDWLDFSIENLSKYSRFIELNNIKYNDAGFNQYENKLTKYMDDTTERRRQLEELFETNNRKPLLHPTIVVISPPSISPSGDSENENEKHRARELAILNMGATIASLLRIGVGRIVYTGITEEDAIVTAHNTDDYDTEISYVQLSEELYKTSNAKINGRKGAIDGLQRALFKGEDAEKWLGTKHPNDYWKYVYYTEPDLLLQTRMSALTPIYEALENHHNVLMPHNFHLVPHETDLTDGDTIYDNDNKYLHASGKFMDILELNGDEDMCCDAGSDRPEFTNDGDQSEHSCPTFWYECGFRPQWIKEGIPEVVRQRRLLEFAPFLRTTQGSTLVSIPASVTKRRCHPRKRQEVNEVC